LWLKGRLKTRLDQYAALHAQTYGEAVDAVTLIPHMLEAFMAGDRGFRRQRSPATEAIGPLPGRVKRPSQQREPSAGNG